MLVLNSKRADVDVVLYWSLDACWRSEEREEKESWHGVRARVSLLPCNTTMLPVRFIAGEYDASQRCGHEKK